MSPKKVIQCNVINKTGITLAINQLTEYRDKEFKRQRSEFMKAVGRAIAKRVEARYAEVDNVNARKFEINVDTNGAFGHVYVWARGIGLFFVEFGTGNLATSGMGWRYGFYAGSWSIDHEQTYQRWAEANTGRPYYYDNESADAFVRAIGHLDEILQEAGDEVFK